MNPYILTAVDLSGIQAYIFNSNNLKHIIGASELVYRATRQWVYEILAELGPTNINPAGKFQPKTISADNLTSELIYAGGGNAVIVFQNDTLAKTFAQKLTRRALQEAPGLELVIAHISFEWGQQGRGLSDVVKETFDKLRDKKRHRARSMPLLGLGVTAACQFTERPAVDEDEEKRRISAEIQAKLKAVPLARDRLIQEAGWPEETFSDPIDFDDFGRTEGESSYIAVIHADGNKMGQRIQAIANQTYVDPYRDYIIAMRNFSEQLNQAAQESLRATVTLLKDSVKDRKIGHIELKPDKIKNKLFLPFRPLVFGGDDLTFVCEGRLGLTLTAFYLRHFTTQHHLPPDDQPIYARAGVAVVKTHYPFARTYNLAEELAKNAKKYINGRSISAIDWHFAVSGLVLELGNIRQREFTVPAGDLFMRPVRVEGQVPDDRQSWDIFSRIVGQFQKDALNGKRSKIKTLREALRGGPAQVQAFLTNFDYHLPNVLPNVPGLAETGWDGKRCAYFDAIEAMEFFTPLEKGGDVL
jgi:hypothetical protein